MDLHGLCAQKSCDHKTWSPAKTQQGYLLPNELCIDPCSPIRNRKTPGILGRVSYAPIRLWKGHALVSFEEHRPEDVGDLCIHDRAVPISLDVRK